MYPAVTYKEHFRLKEAPFSATPDPRFFYENHAYHEAWAMLLHGIRDRQRFIVLTGEVGTGKTTLLRRLMDELAGTTRFIFLYHTTLTSEEPVHVLCHELDLPVEGCGRVKKLRVLNDFLLAQAERGDSVVLLVDEAQNLSPEVLENLRLISNLETTKKKLLPIVLVGQPELEARLDDPRLRQVKQRVAIRCHLEPLPKEQIQTYIRHRLRVAGRPIRLFSSDAIRRIANYTRGIPRLINILCHAGLLLAYAADANMVSGRMIDEAATDLIVIAAGSALGSSTSFHRLCRGCRAIAEVRLAGCLHYPSRQARTSPVSVRPVATESVPIAGRSTTRIRASQRGPRDHGRKNWDVA